MYRQADGSPASRARPTRRPRAENPHSFGHSPTSALGKWIFNPVLAAPPIIDFRLVRQYCSIYYYYEEH